MSFTKRLKDLLRFWDKPGKFEVEYFQEYGWAAMKAVSIIEASSRRDATLNWKRYIREKGFLCTDSASLNSITRLPRSL